MESTDVKAWVAVVSRAHVLRGVEGGFAQVCHGKQAPLRKMQPGDWLAYYSPTTEFGAGEPLRAFTALGRIADSQLYEFDMGGGFIPWRRDVRYLARNPVALAALHKRLEFTKDPNWGWLARRGHFEISLADMNAIAHAMGARI